MGKESHYSGYFYLKQFDSFNIIDFSTAITKMNNKLIDTDYIFGPDGTLVKR